MNLVDLSNYDWLQADTLEVAPKLLGWELQTWLPDGVTGGIIIETEAYRGANDPASHAYINRTARNQPMFETGGRAYVYLSYGLHVCLNIVTGPADNAQAVLIRAVIPTSGVQIMTERRSRLRTVPARELVNGPGKLGQALGLKLADSGTLLGGVIRLVPPVSLIDASGIVAGPRIGITRGQELPWRFRWRPNGTVTGATGTGLPQ